MIWGALIEFGHVYIVEELLTRKREAHGKDAISIRGFAGYTHLIQAHNFYYPCLEVVDLLIPVTHTDFLHI